MIWGTQQKSVSRPPGLTGASTLFGATIPTTTSSSSCWARPSRSACGSCCSARGWGASSGPPRSTARRSGALGVNVNALYTWVFVIASFLGGLGGALISPMRATTPGMDTEIIVEAFVVVVIGGLGSFLGHVPRRAHLRPGACRSASCSSRASRSSPSSPSWPAC
jgi:hypothetical protein